MTYTYCCVYSARLLMMDRKTVRNMQSSIPKMNLRNCASRWFYYKNISRCTVTWMSDYCAMFRCDPTCLLQLRIFLSNCCHVECHVVLMWARSEIFLLEITWSCTHKVLHFSPQSLLFRYHEHIKPATKVACAKPRTNYEDKFVWCV